MMTAIQETTVSDVGLVMLVRMSIKQTEGHRLMRLDY